LNLKRSDEPVISKRSKSNKYKCPQGVSYYGKSNKKERGIKGKLILDGDDLELDKLYLGNK